MSPLSGVLGEAWTYYKRFAAHFLLIAFVIYVAAGIIAALLGLAGSVGLFLGWIVSVVAAFLVQAALVKAVQDVRDGQVDLNLGETVSAVLPFLGTVVIASILAGIGIAIGFVLIIVPGLILLTFLVADRAQHRDRRGGRVRLVPQELADRPRLLAVSLSYAPAFLILIVFDIVIGLILLFLPVVARNAISSIVSGTLVAPFLALVVTLIYYRLTAVHGAKDGPGEAQWPPPRWMPRIRGRAPGQVLACLGPGSVYPGSGSTSPGAGPTSPGLDTPAPRAGHPAPRAGDLGPPGPGSAPAGPGVPPTSPATPPNVSAA